MRLLNLRQHRILLHFIAASLFGALIYLWMFGISELYLPNHQKSEACRLLRVKGNSASCPHSTTTHLEAQPCFWSIEVIDDLRQEVRLLHTPGSEHLRPEQVSFLQRLDGCNSTTECENEAVSCSYGVEDPSDALWLRDYQNSIKFVVMLKIGFASFAFFIAASICDGAIFEPHRTGFSNSLASLLFLIAISSLLYILLVPMDLQLSLYGAGPLQSIGFVFLILSIACLLPAAVVIWINVSVFFVFFLGFLLEQLAYIFVGIMHFLGVLSLYQAENTLLHLRIVYSRTALGQAEFDRSLVGMSRRFLSRTRRNWYLQHLRQVMEDDAMQIMSNVLPRHLFDEVMHEDIPQLEFEDVVDEENVGGETESRRRIDVNEETPLLQQNGRASTT